LAVRGVWVSKTGKLLAWNGPTLLEGNVAAAGLRRLPLRDDVHVLAAAIGEQDTADVGLTRFDGRVSDWNYAAAFKPAS
jgi:hypothetical protein